MITRCLDYYRTTEKKKRTDGSNRTGNDFISFHFGLGQLSNFVDILITFF